MPPVSREEHEDLARRISEGKATQEELRLLIAEGKASGVVLGALVDTERGKLLIVTHTLQGDGVVGLVDRVGQLEVWQKSLYDTPKEQKANKYRTILAVVSVMAGLYTLISVGSWLTGLFKK